MKTQGASRSSREGLPLGEFHKLFGFVYDILDGLLKRLAEKGRTLLLGDRAELEVAVDGKWADEVEQLRARVVKATRPEHASHIRSALYAVASDAYGENSEWAKSHGNRIEDAVIVALGGPGKAAEFSKFCAEWAGGVEFEMSVEGIAALLQKVQERLNNAAPNLPAGASTRQRMDARAAFEGGIVDVKRRISWLRRWLSSQGVQPPEAGKSTEAGTTTHPATEPAGRGIDAVKVEIEAAMGRIRMLNAEADDFAAKKQFKAASDRQDEATRIETGEISRLRRELETLEAAQVAIAREQAAAVIARQAPPAPGDKPALAAPARVVEDSGDPDEGEPLEARIARLEEEITDQSAAADRHEAEAGKLFAEADALRVEGKRGEAARTDFGGEREKQAAEAALKAATVAEERHALLVQQLKDERAKAAAKAPEPAPVKSEPTTTEPVAEPKPAPEPKASDPLAGAKAKIAAKIAEAAVAGNTAMVTALTAALQSLEK